MNSVFLSAKSDSAKNQKLIKTQIHKELPESHAHVWLSGI
jgi:hypothetical protein